MIRRGMCRLVADNQGHFFVAEHLLANGLFEINEWWRFVSVSRCSGRVGAGLGGGADFDRWRCRFALRGRCRHGIPRHAAGQKQQDEPAKRVLNFHVTADAKWRHTSHVVILSAETALHLNRGGPRVVNVQASHPVWSVRRRRRLHFALPSFTVATASFDEFASHPVRPDGRFAPVESA